MNDYDSETFLQDLLATLIEGFNDQTCELDNPVPVQHQMHYLLSILACLTQALDGLDGRMIDLNNEIHNINNALKGRGHE